MGKTVTLESLADKLVRLEKEVIILRRQLAQLNQRVVTSEQFANLPVAEGSIWADKEPQKKWMKQFMAQFGIQATPIGAERLQQEMGASGLEANELSRSLIAAREE